MTTRPARFRADVIAEQSIIGMFATNEGDVAMLREAFSAARADERARLRAAVESLPGEVGHFDGGDDFDTGFLTRAAVLALLADPPADPPS